MLVLEGLWTILLFVRLARIVYMFICQYAMRKSMDNPFLMNSGYLDKTNLRKIEVVIGRRAFMV